MSTCSTHPYFVTAVRISGLTGPNKDSGWGIIVQHPRRSESQHIGDNDRSRKSRIVDVVERIDPLLRLLGEMIGEGLGTVTPIDIMRYLRDPNR